MAFSKVDIANLALEHLGKNEIASLTADTLEAKRCNKWIDWAIDMALARSPWSFAGKVATLADVTNDYEQRWAYKADLPNDLVKMRYVVADFDPFPSPPNQPIHFEVLGGSLYSNIQAPAIKYTYRNQDPTTWPPKFAEAVSFLLARTISMALTKKMSFYDAMDQLYERSILQAIEIDASQDIHEYGYDNGGYNAARGADESGDLPYKSVDGSIYWD